jgi:preprotein translocase subunit SecG
MTEKVYWGLASLLAAAIIIVGVKFYQPLLTALHIIVSATLLLVVLLQSGRAADLAGAFGGAGSQTAFGPRGAATLLSKATTFLAVVFMLTSLSLAIFSTGTAATSLAEEAAQTTTEQTEEVAPAPAEEAPAPFDEAPAGDAAPPPPPEE